MKAILTKKIKVEIAKAYLIFEKEQARPDIVDFINGKEFEDKVINSKVKEYLRKLKIIDDQNNITKKGEKIKNTGKLFVYEEGKYEIWFTEENKFLPTRILRFKRIRPIENSRIEELKICFDKDNYYLPTTNDDFSFLRLNIDKPVVGQLNGESEDLNLIWNWNGIESSNFYFTGILIIMLLQNTK